MNWAAVTGNFNVIRKYYYAGSQRHPEGPRERETGSLRWLLGDHLGSTVYTVNGTTKTGEVRYHPFGTNRYTSGQTLTSYKFTGQRHNSGHGCFVLPMVRFGH